MYWNIVTLIVFQYVASNSSVYFLSSPLEVSKHSML